MFAGLRPSKMFQASCLSGTFYIIGDVMAQTIVEPHILTKKNPPPSLFTVSGAQVTGHPHDHINVHTHTQPIHPNSLNNNSRDETATSPAGQSWAVLSSSAISSNGNGNGSIVEGKKSLKEVWAEFRDSLDDLDTTRTARMAAFGFGIAGWFFYSGFHVLDNIIGPSTTITKSATKALMSQLFFSPPFLSTFIIYGAYFRNDESLYETWRERFPNLYANACTVWPAVNLITFRFLPEGLSRIVFINAVGVGWTAWMTAVGAAKQLNNGADEKKEVSVGSMQNLSARKDV
ncbi:hypothetical protein HDU76_004738 [Blyttiomyces sp. JEL0837]|nr:hypothetical protein HDU76_004738 [Blyttiomyces sp. JEL0837]